MTLISNQIIRNNLVWGGLRFINREAVYKKVLTVPNPCYMSITWDLLNFFLILEFSTITYSKLDEFTFKMKLK